MRWTQYKAQLFQNIISSRCVIMTYSKEGTEPQEQGFFEKLKDYDFLRLMCFIVDLTSLFSRFQKKPQSDSVMVFDIKESLERSLSRLQQLNENKPLVGGWEEHLSNNVTEQDGMKYLHSFKLC